MTASRLEPSASQLLWGGKSDKINEQLSSYRETEEIIGLRCGKLPRLASFIDIDFLRDDEKNNTEEERKRKDSCLLKSAYTNNY